MARAVEVWNSEHMGQWRLWRATEPVRQVVGCFGCHPSAAASCTASLSGALVYHVLVFICKNLNCSVLSLRFLKSQLKIKEKNCLS